MILINMNMFFTSKVPAYLIDSENVGSTWADLLKKEEKSDFYIFVTENAKSLNFSLLKELTDNQRHKINIIECEPGKNSLDFYLSSYLGYLIGTGKHSSFTVVSQDNGFDHVIEYWKRNGLDVSKINTKPNKGKETKTVRASKSQAVKKNENSETRIIVKKQPAEPVKSENKPNRKKSDAQAKTGETGNNRKLLQNLLKDYPENEIEEVARYLDAIPADKHGDKSYIYRHLIRKFKSEKGLAIYTLIKKDLEKYYRH